MKERLYAEAEKIRAHAQSDAQCGSNAQCAQREKYWVELSIEEKIERMRLMVKNYGHALEQIERQRAELRQLRQNLNTHRHAMEDGGKVMLPADRRGEDSEIGYIGKDATCEDPAKSYF